MQMVRAATGAMATGPRMAPLMGTEAATDVPRPGDETRYLKRRPSSHRCLDVNVTVWGDGKKRPAISLIPTPVMVSTPCPLGRTLRKTLEADGHYKMVRSNVWKPGPEANNVSGFNNLEEVPDQIPDSLTVLFEGIDTFNQDISGWDTSNVTWRALYVLRRILFQPKHRRLGHQQCDQYGFMFWASFTKTSAIGTPAM